MTQLNIEEVVGKRYTEGALARQETLCCPTDYDDRYLAVLPGEIIERDYGCGDPSAYVREGETVLDLGSGSGKTCYIAAQVVGPSGHVIGIDMNDDMLALARRHQSEIARRLGYNNVSFHRGKIQDLRTDLDAVDAYLQRHPVASARDLAAFERFRREQQSTHPLVADNAVDVVVSNCVLNLVSDDDKQVLFAELFRVLRPGGRAVICDIVSDECVPQSLKEDPDLWSGCIAGAFQEGAFLDAFATAGFYGIELLKRDVQPWRTVAGIEFRSVAVQAWKGKQGECWDYNQAVIYRGPWSEVRDDDGHTLRRGVPMAVCEKTFRLYTREPYARGIIPVAPRVAVDPATARPFDCTREAVRHPRETKGRDYQATSAAPATCCGPAGDCC
ncbi:MAG: methyltransferase domain-containing protein [Candidatus Binatia bacterium]